MSTAFERRSMAVLLALSVVTFISWWIGGRHGATTFDASAPATFSVLAVAALKARIIVMEFMEARHARPLLRWLLDGWLLLLLGTLLAVYLWPR